LATPKKLVDFYGQPDAVSVLEDMIASAKFRNTSVGHFLLYGGPGLGKTTLANIIANEMGVACHLKIAHDFRDPEELLMYIAYSMKSRDVILLDEIHSIKKPVEEGLFHYMETRHMDLKVQLKDFPIDIQKEVSTKYPNYKKTSDIKLNGYGPNITIIGATTNPECLSGPFIDRFQSLIELYPYTMDTMKVIINNICEKSEIHIEKDAVIELAKRSKETVRISHNLIQACRDNLLANRQQLFITKENVLNTMKKHGIDMYGLKRRDREYLKVVEKNGPIGIATIAKMLGYRNTMPVDEIIEPYIMRHGWVTVETGRKLTKIGQKVVDDLRSNNYL
jgi:Holliday junction DNA helicase RuvB